MNRPGPAADGTSSDDGGQAADPILGPLGLGKEIWMNEDADAYVRRLRETWECGSEIVHAGVGGESG